MRWLWRLSFAFLGPTKKYTAVGHLNDMIWTVLSHAAGAERLVLHVGAPGAQHQQPGRRPEILQRLVELFRRTDNEWVLLVLRSVNGSWPMKRLSGGNGMDGRQSAPPSAGVGAGVEHARTPTPFSRAHWSLAGWPPVSHGRALPHATCSQPGSAGGGTPARGTRAVHTSGCPQTGHRSAGTSPQVSPACGAPYGGGTSSRPWPTAAGTGPGLPLGCGHTAPNRARARPRLAAHGGANAR